MEDLTYFGNFPCPENREDFKIQDFKGLTSVATYARSEWDALPIAEKRRVFSRQHVHVVGRRARPVLGIDSWDEEQLAASVDIWQVRQCHGMCSLLRCPRRVGTALTRSFQLKRAPSLLPFLAGKRTLHMHRRELLRVTDHTAGGRVSVRGCAVVNLPPRPVTT